MLDLGSESVKVMFYSPQYLLKNELPMTERNLEQEEGSFRNKSAKVA